MCPSGKVRLVKVLAGEVEDLRCLVTRLERSQSCLARRAAKSLNRRLTQCPRFRYWDVPADSCYTVDLVFRGGSMRVVVTGGAGFLGSHLCDRLLAAVRAGNWWEGEFITSYGRNFSRHG